MTNLEQYKGDLDKLISWGVDLINAMRYECFPEKIESSAKKRLGLKSTEYLRKLPSFVGEYQGWYSEAKSLLRQLLPDRLSDFASLYEVPKGRKEVDHESYRISDYLSGLSTTRGRETIAGPSSAITRFEQQLAIVKASKRRFTSSLFDIKQLVQADLFDSELEAATELAKRGFLRAAGAVAGVVLEKHLAQVCQNHSVAIRKKKPTVSNLNDGLKEADIIDVPQWRGIQCLGDIRNMCDHNKEVEPTKNQVTELIDGVMKLTKTLY